VRESFVIMSFRAAEQKRTEAFKKGENGDQISTKLKPSIISIKKIEFWKEIVIIA
jgi:hypothetical protein